MITFNLPTNIDFISTHKFTTLQCKSCGHFHVVPVYCGNRFCSFCSKPRLMRVRLKLRDLMDKTSLKNGENFRHLILTITSQADPREMVKDLVDYFKKFRNRSVFKKNFSGGAYVIELTCSDSGWHAHIHCIVQGLYIPQAILLSTWRSIAGRAGLFIKTIPKSAIINYLTKYISEIKLAGNLADEAGKALKGQRLFICFGSWHNLIAKWTKIPYECPVCGCIEWKIFLASDLSDEYQISQLIADKYG
jgi:hypothetical protein